MDKDPFQSSKYLVDRAEHHLLDFKTQVESFFLNEKPAKYVREIDPSGKFEVHKVKLVKNLPVHLPGIVFDAINGLRSALDQATSTVASLSGCPPGFTYFFPIGNTDDDFKNAVKGRCKGFPDELTLLYTRFNAYKGGNDFLWVMNNICNSNKHGLSIKPIGLVATSWLTEVPEFRAGPGGGSAVMSIGPPIWDRTKNEIIIATHSVGTKVEPKFQCSMRVAVCDVELIDGHQADAVLGNMIHIVKRVVMAIEAEAKRIGLVLKLSSSQARLCPNSRVCLKTPSFASKVRMTDKR